MDSACPVVSVVTWSYVAVLAEPPEYPTVVFTTPFTRSKTACVPQKHPPAKTAVSRPLDLARGRSTLEGGIGRTGSALAEQPRREKAKAKAIIPRKNISTPEFLD